MLIYTRPLYHAMPQETARAWPRTILVEVSRSGASTWTLVYDNGTHHILKGRAQVELFDPRLTNSSINAYYLLSRRAGPCLN
jgi:hypothetical protein